LNKDKQLTNCNGTANSVFISSHIQAEGPAVNGFYPTYTLQKGNSTTVTITTKDTAGAVAADAICLCL
jgi:hypothetical protein